MESRESQTENVASKRRSLLKSVATTSVLGIAGTSSTVQAETKPVTPNTSRKPDYQEVVTAFTKYATELLSLLADEGLLESGTVRDLPLEKSVDYDVVASKSEGVNFSSWDGHADEYRVVKRLDEGVLSVAVQPAENHAYAFYTDRSGSTYIAKPGHGMKDVSTLDSSCLGACLCADKCGDSYIRDQYCCVYYPCESDDTCSWNTFCDAGC